MTYNTKNWKRNNNKDITAVQASEIPWASQFFIHFLTLANLSYEKLNQLARLEE